MSEPRIIQFPGCEVRLWPDYLETVFRVPAAASDDPESVERARDLGYPDTWSMSRDHELLHHILAVGRGLKCSPVLLGVAVRNAGGRKESIISPEDSDREELLVIRFQRYLMTRVLEPELEASGLDLEALSAELLSYVAEVAG